MNDLDLMARFRDDTAPIDGDAWNKARARLMAEAAGPSPARPRTRLSRRLLPVAALALAVTGPSVAVLMTRPSAPEPGGSPQAVEVLRLAAAEARQEPALRARPDQFVFVESLAAWAGGETTTSGEEVRHAPVEMSRRMWLSADGSRDGLLRQTPSHPGVKNPMPETAEVPLPACTEEPVRSCGTNPAYQSDLPTGAVAMRDLLYAGGADDHAAFEKVDDLVREAYAPPAAEAALFEAAATIPGIVRVPEAVDLAGRRGIAVARIAHGSRYELIFDASTYRFLGERQVITEASAGSPPPGTVVGFTARLRTAIVDEVGRLP